MKKDLIVETVNGFDILESIVLPIILIDKSSKIIYANGYAEDFFMISRKSLLKSFMDSFFCDKTTIFSLIEKLIHSQRSVAGYDIEIMILHHSKKIVSVFLSTYISNPIFFVLTIHDKTALHTLEKNVDFSKVSNGITNMTALLAHEIKNPLSGIKGAAQLLQSSLPETEKELTALICEEVERIKKLVDRTSVLGDQPMQWSEVNIYSILEHAKKIAEKGFASGIEIKTNYDTSMPLIQADKDQLIQVFLNILKNASEAIKATPLKEGIIDIKVAYESRIFKNSLSRNKNIKLPLLISIIDNGIGIPESIKHQLFVPFASQKPYGKGLGLAICSKIINDHGGIINITSENNETKVNIHLPLKLNIQ